MSNENFIKIKIYSVHQCCDVKEYLRVNGLIGTKMPILPF